MRYELRQVWDNLELYRIEEDGTETLLGSDRGEPEDNTFQRDWSWVPDELDRLAKEITTLRNRLGFTERMARHWYQRFRAFFPEFGREDEKTFPFLAARPDEEEDDAGQ